MPKEPEDTRLRSAGLFAVGSIALVICAFVWANHVDSRRNTERIMAERQLQEIEGAGAVGTAGRNQAPAAVSEETIRSIDSITGGNARALIGRKVDLRAKVSDAASDLAFWVGTGSNRVMVVVGRDDRIAVRASGEQSAPGGYTVVRPGEPLQIIGTIQAMPGSAPSAAPQGAGSGTSAQPTIYIRAERVIPR